MLSSIILKLNIFKLTLVLGSMVFQHLSQTFHLKNVRFVACRRIRKMERNVKGNSLQERLSGAPQRTHLVAAGGAADLGTLSVSSCS